MNNKKIIIVVIIILLLIAIIGGIVYYFKDRKNYELDNCINNYLEDEDISIENFYTSQITEKYDVITDLDKDYSIEDAKRDMCFIVSYAKVYNENLYDEFMQNYNDKKFAFSL